MGEGLPPTPDPLGLLPGNEVEEAVELLMHLAPGWAAASSQRPACAAFALPEAPWGEATGPLEWGSRSGGRGHQLS